MHIHHLHRRELPDSGARDLGRCDEPVLAISMHEDFEVVAGLRAFRDVLPGKENLAEFLPVEVKPRRGFAHNAEGVSLTYRCHISLQSNRARCRAETYSSGIVEVLRAAEP